MLTPFVFTWSGQVKRDERSQVELAVRILRNRHLGDVLARSQDILGPRSRIIGPIDMSRNVLRSWVDRIGRAYDRPPLVSGLSAELASAMGDSSAITTVAKYGRAGGRPLPTTAIEADRESLRYELGAGYAGVLIGWSRRTGRIYLDVVTPDDLQLEYASDDPTEPTVIRHRGTRLIGGEVRSVVEVYDLTDLDAPSYRIYDGDADVTERVLGESFIGEGYTRWWSLADGRPFHRILIRGSQRNIYERLQQVEASLVVPVRWTAWGSGTDHASHPGRNVRGMTLIGTSSDADTGEVGFADGPETIKVWSDNNPDRAGDHWQDAPAFDPLTTAKALGFYESLTLSLIDLPIQIEATGGEPTETERRALDVRIASTYAGCRRFDAELLARCAALANRLPEVAGDGLPESGYGCLYGAEIDEALAVEETETDTDTDTEPEEE